MPSVRRLNKFNKIIGIVVGLILVSGFTVLSHQDDDYFQMQKILAGDGAANDRFGWSVSVYNDTAVIGAPGDDESGSMYVFEYSSSTWNQTAKLVADDGEADDRFGHSVSVHDDTAVAGAHYDDTDNGSDSGSAYIFEYNGTSGNWTQAAKLTANDGAADDWFGHSVSLSSNTAVIGAYSDVDNGIRSGSAYVFAKNSTTTSGNWNQTAKLIANDGAVDDYFGWSVSVYNDTAVIGAHRDDDNGIRSGSAYIFERNSTSGNWTQAAKLAANDGAVGDWFGYSVSLYNDTALISAPGDDANGSAYIFERSSTTSGNWTQAAKIAASDGAVGDWFGYSVSLYNDTAVIDARHNDDNGAAYIFKKNSTASGNWNQTAKLTAGDVQMRTYLATPYQCTTTLP